jgi:hypothetical protein
MVILHSNNKLPANKIRNPCYKQVIPLFTENHELYTNFPEVHAVSESAPTEAVMTSETGPISLEKAEARAETVHESSLVESKVGEQHLKHLEKVSLLLPSEHVRRLTSIVSDLMASPSPSSPAGRAGEEKKAEDEG